MIRYTSIDRIFATIRRDFGSLQEIHESDIIEWIGEALELMGASANTQEDVAFIEVKDHQCFLPYGLVNITQIANNNCWDGETNKVCATHIEEIIAEEETDGVIIDCAGTPVEDYEVAYYRPFLNTELPFASWSSSNLHTGCFTPIRPMSHTMQGASGECNNCREEYRVIDGTDMIRFSFKEGQVSIAYSKTITDEDGYPMIPDHASVITALSSYVAYKIAKRELYSNQQGAYSKKRETEADWHWYCNQAKNKLFMPNSVDDWQNLLDQRRRIIPSRYQYYKFFGSMNVPEQRSFNDPDQRNHNYYRGYRGGN